ncbi:MAG: CPBP family glutamic-type intramembrane protease [Candidatus Woesebacteria bacterium]
MTRVSAHLFKDSHYLFWMLVLLSFFSLVVYRFTVHAPIWFDEIIFKALIFGAPVWIYALLTKKKPSFFGLEASTFWVGAFNGLAIGGLLSFIAIVTYSFRKQTMMIPGLFSSGVFWNEFGLAFATAWWESLFFYGLILPVVRAKCKDDLNALAFVSVIFLLFHMPNLVLKVGLMGSFQPLLLLTAFAFGQGIIFLRTKSVATVVVSHAFWGMALLVYGR